MWCLNFKAIKSPLNAIPPCIDLYCFPIYIISEWRLHNKTIHVWWWFHYSLVLFILSAFPRFYWYNLSLISCAKHNFILITIHFIVATNGKFRVEWQLVAFLYSCRCRVMWFAMETSTEDCLDCPMNIIWFRWLEINFSVWGIAIYNALSTQILSGYLNKCF